MGQERGNGGATRFGAWLLAERKRRGWTRPMLAALLRKAGRQEEPYVSVVEDTIKGWELRGHVPRGDMLQVLAQVLEVPVEELVALTNEKPVDGAGEALDLARLADASDAGSGAVESTLAAVERLRRGYARTPPHLLATEIRTRLQTIRQLLHGRLRLAQHRDLLASAGWLSLLLATVSFDLRERETAHAYRDAALLFAREVGHQELEAWTWETPAWFAVFQHRYHDAVDLSRRAQELAPKRSAIEVVATLQEGRAWARLGARSEALATMDRAATLVESLPVPEHPDDHYTFDPPKFGHYAAMIYAWLGESRPAEYHARNVIRDCGDRSKPTWWPVRVAVAQVNLGLALALRGEIDAAGFEASKAFDLTFLRGTTLSMAVDLDRLLAAHPDVAEARDFHERLVLAREALPE